MNTEEAVPGGERRVSHGQRGLKRRDSGDDTVYAIGKAAKREEEDKQPSVLECGSTG